MWTKTAKSPASSNVFPVMPLAPCGPGAFFLPFTRQRQSALACTARRVPFSSVLPLAPCGPGAFFLPFTRQRQSALACTARRVPFLRSCLWSSAGRRLSFCLSRAKGKRRLSLQCLLCLLRPCMRGFFPYPSGRPVLPCFPPSLLRPTPAFQSPDTTKTHRMTKGQTVRYGGR